MLFQDYEGQPIWTNPYVFPQPPILGITAALPIYKEDKLDMILGADLTLDTASELLKAQTIGKNGISYIIEKRKAGPLIATSVGGAEFADPKDPNW